MVKHNGYLVSLINTSTTQYKKINDFEEMKNFFIENGLIMQRYPSSSEIAFYDEKDPDFTVFFLNDEYFINTTNDAHIEKLIELANSLNDGTRVVGDEGETYKSLSEVYYHPDDPPYIEYKPPTLLDKIKSNLIWFFGVIIFVVLEILLK